MASADVVQETSKERAANQVEEVSGSAHTFLFELSPSIQGCCGRRPPPRTPLQDWGDLGSLAPPPPTHLSLNRLEG